MRYEIKRLCAEHRWREAIEFVARIKPEPGSGKTECLLAIGNEVTSQLPEGLERDMFLISIIEGLLRLGDIEHPRALLLALSCDSARERFLEPIEESIHTRQWNFVESEN